MALSRDLALTPEELDELLRSEWNMRISTLSPSGAINCTPLWFVWHDRRIWAYCRGQKVVNLRRNPRCTVLVDRAERFPELQGAMIQGDGQVLEDVDAERAEAQLADVEREYRLKYAGGYGEHEAISPLASPTARGRTWRWVIVTPRSVTSWDNHKFVGSRNVSDG